MNKSRWLRWICAAGILAVVACVIESWPLSFSVFSWARSFEVAESDGPAEPLPLWDTASKIKTVSTTGRAAFGNGSLGNGSSSRLQMDRNDPAGVLEKVAETILSGPPLVVDFRGQANLEVALRPLKSVRGRSSIVPMSGTFSSLGQGTGLARWQVNIGSPTAVTMNLVSQQQETLIYSSVPGAVQGLVSTQPDWFRTTASASGDSNFRATSLYGSPTSLVQWLPHHMECFWGDLAELPLPVQRLAMESADHEGHLELQRVVMVGTVRPSVAARFGIAVPTEQGLSNAARGLAVDDWQVFAGWARQVPVPLPHVVEIHLRSEQAGVFNLERVSFFRVHPLRPELDEMVRFEWGPWQVAAGLTQEDVVVRVEKP